MDEVSGGRFIDEERPDYPETRGHLGGDTMVRLDRRAVGSAGGVAAHHEAVSSAEVDVHHAARPGVVVQGVLAVCGGVARGEPVDGRGPGGEPPLRAAGPHRPPRPTACGAARRGGGWCVVRAVRQRLINSGVRPVAAPGPPGPGTVRAAGPRAARVAPRDRQARQQPGDPSARPGPGPGTRPARLTRGRRARR